jgi:hypothetical protein
MKADEQAEHVEAVLAGLVHWEQAMLQGSQSLVVVEW